MNAFQWHSCELLSCDRFGNRVHDGGAAIHIAAVGADLSARTDDLKNGSYTLSVMPKLLQGSVTLAISVDGVQIIGSPFLVRVLAGTAINFIRWRFENPPCSGCCVDDKLSIPRSESFAMTVDVDECLPFALQPEHLRVQLRAPNRLSYDATVVALDGADTASGSRGLRATFKPEFVGEHRLHVSICEHALKSIPYRLIVEGDACSRHTRIRRPLPHACLAGEMLAIWVEGRDEAAQPVTVGGAELQVVIKTPGGTEAHPSCITDHRNGQYEVAVSFETAGKYWIAVRLGRSYIQGCPCSVDVLPSAVDPLSSELRFVGFSERVPAMTESFLEIVLRDQFGNSVEHNAVGLQVFVLEGQAKSHISSSPNGRLALAITPIMLTGLLSFQLEINGLPVKNSPCRVQVSSGTILHSFQLATKHLEHGKLLPQHVDLKVGEALQFVIRVASSTPLLQAITASDVKVKVSSFLKGTCSFASVSFEVDQYQQISVVHSPLDLGAYQVCVEVVGEQLRGSPFTVAVHASFSAQVRCTTLHCVGTRCSNSQLVVPTRNSLC
jgi:hypothetical protein